MSKFKKGDKVKIVGETSDYPWINISKEEICEVSSVPGEREYDINTLVCRDKGVRVYIPSKKKVQWVHTEDLEIIE